jgi:hypothetical protein
MKKFLLLLFSLAFIALFVIGCQPADSEEALVGDAISTSTGIKVEHFFLLNTPTGGEILEYKGADKLTKTNPKIKFKRFSTGNTLEYALSAEGEATIKVNGASFDVRVRRPNIDDSPITVDLNSDGEYDRDHRAVPLHYETLSGGICNPSVESATECLPTLQDFEISAHAVQGVENQSEFEVNGEHFTLDVGDENYELVSGAVVGIDRTLIQDYAGGLRGVEWDLVGACSSDFAFETYYDDSLDFDAKFTVVSTSSSLSPVSEEESFNLNRGESKMLRDGSKIILLDSITQAYAGGLHGVTFELLCS